MTRSGKVRQLFLALILTVFMWLLHNMSLEYSSTLQYSVIVSSSLEGYEAEAVSTEPLILRGTASGYHLMRVQGFGDETPVLHLRVDPSELELVDQNAGVFRLKVSDLSVRDRISAAIGDGVSVEVIDTEYLSFSFQKRDCRKVPVRANAVLFYRSQYMPVGGITLFPDSVLVYGEPSALESIVEVNTSTVRRRSVDKDIRGTLSVSVPAGLTVYPKKVAYSVKVERYVESTETVEVSVRNVPDGKSVLLFPSKVDVSYRKPFTRSNRRKPSLEAYVDYTEYELSSGTRVIPVVSISDSTVSSYTINPMTVECIVSDGRE
ncbi:MAG: hypothetical protein KBT00_05790 [Bacteroidales bacterium]|nr:hypothetical protein [Candidatus Cacconaster merdequi]